MINVIGLGYIGLPTALVLAKTGYDVIGTDINKNLVSKLSNGVLSFFEEGLDELFESALKNNIKFSTNYQSTNLYIVAVPTPYISKNKKVDMSFVLSAVKNILKVSIDDAIIVIESTISPGSIDKHIRPVLNLYEKQTKRKVHIAHAPERIIPGNMLYELVNNSRTIGVDDQFTSNILKKVYSKFCQGEIVITDIKSAEMSKVIENTYRDINIAFANELAKICRADNMNVYEIIRIANKHPRVNILSPGPGVGGHCISVDPWFLAGEYPEIAKLIRVSRDVNDSMPSHVLSRIRTAMVDNEINDLGRVGLYGLTYKEDVDDTRESPTLQLLHLLDKHLSKGMKIFDPYIEYEMVENQYFDFQKFVDDIDIIVIMVSHKHIKNNMDKIKNKVIIDTKNALNFKKSYKL